MIAYSGYFGAGKTYHMTVDLFKAYKNGHFVVTNYKTTFSHLYLENFDDFITFMNNLYILIEKAKKPLLKNKKIYIGMDEGAVFFNSRRFSSYPPILLDFLPQLRKLGVELFYTVQYPSLIDVNFRRFTEYWHIYKKMHPSFSWGWFHDHVLNAENPDLKNDLNGNERLSKIPIFFVFRQKYFDKYSTFQILKSSSTNPIYCPIMTQRIMTGINNLINEIKEKVSLIKRLYLKVKIQSKAFKIS